MYKIYLGTAAARWQSYKSWRFSFP